MNTKPAKKIDQWAAFLLLMITIGNFQPHPPQDVSLYPYGGAVINTLNNTASYSLLSILMIRHWRKILYAATRSISLISLLGLILISILWSANPQLTLENFKGMTRLFLFAAYFSYQYSLKEQMWMLSIPLSIQALLSFFVAIFFPSHGGGADGWSGIYGHKNDLGSNMALSAGIFLLLTLSSGRNALMLWTLLLVTVILTVFSKSTTAVGILFIFIILLFIYKLLQKNQYKVQVVFIALAILLVMSGSIWLLGNAQSIVATQGKDLSFTGRTPLWMDLIGKIEQRPLFGYGFYGFWSSLDALDIKVKYSWAAQAHNGFIQLGLDLGLIGFTLFTASAAKFFLQALSRIIFRSSTWDDFWPMQFLAFIILLNFAEASLLQPSMFWFLYVTTLLSLSIESERVRRKAHYGLEKTEKIVGL